MKGLLKLAVGAAIAYALVEVLKKQRLGSSLEDRAGREGREEGVQGAGEFTPTELVTDTSSVGEGSGDERVQIPDDGRIGQGRLNS